MKEEKKGKEEYTILKFMVFALLGTDFYFFLATQARMSRKTQQGRQITLA